MSRCRRCGRILKREPWQTLGIGKICSAKEQTGSVNKQSADDQDIILPYDGGDILIERIEAPTELFGTGVTMNMSNTCSGIRCNVPRSVYRHSPTGYNFGYGGSGPADLALNICLMFVRKPEDAGGGVYQDFKFKFLGYPGDRLVIPKATVINFLQDKGIAIKDKFLNLQS